MDMQIHIKKYELFLFSVFIIGLGIAIVMAAELRTTAITSPPYVFSLFTPFSFGMYTMFFISFMCCLKVRSWAENLKRSSTYNFSSVQF